jgi:glycosyltransferase involved in cell wall biosynthesis
MSVSCAAVLCVRNEEVHIERAIGDFVSQGIDVAIIDHGSTDATAQICRDHLGRGVVTVQRLAWHGDFDLTAQLSAKRDVISRLDHDWVVHADADEWLHSPRPGESLLAGVERTAAAGYDAVNFEEFVFLPAPDAGDIRRDYARRSLHYYFFAPQPVRLMRAWSRRRQVSNLTSGGHLLEGAVALSPEAFVLRHYIVLSQDHALAKYSARTFAPGDLRKGWHANRLGLDAARLRLPDIASLHELAAWDSKDFDRSRPLPVHFWDWDDQPPAPAPAPAPAQAAETRR